MCWFFTIRFSERDSYESIDTIEKLISLYKRYDLEVPKKMLKAYELDELNSNLCLCPIKSKYFGDDKLTSHLTKCFRGESKFKKLNNEEIKINYDDAILEDLISEESLPQTITRKELSEDLLFHKIIIKEVFENDQELILECW